MTARTRIVSSIALLLAGACQRRIALPAPPALASTPAPPPPAVRPAPGADLPAAPAPPAAPARRPPPAAPARPLDLGADRPADRVRVPAPPAGGAVGFVFGDARRGWVAHVPGSLQLPAVAYGGGRVFVSGGFETYNFYALDAEDGRFVWMSAQLPDDGPTAPLYDDGRVIFDTESCTLVALEARTGKLLWSKRLGDPTLAQAAAADGLVFASHPGADGGGYALSAYRAATGAHVWSRAVASELYAAPVVDGDSVYAATVGGQSYRIERRTGALVWSRPLRATTAPFVAGDELYLSRRDRGGEAEVVVSAATGAILRAHAALAAPYLADVPRDTTDWKRLWAFEGSRPVVGRGVRYVARGGTIEAADAESGAAYWIRRDGGARGARSVGTVALAGPEVVVSTRDGQLYGLDVDTGYTLWAYDIGHRVLAEPIVARGWVYLATADGLVVALEVADPSLDGWHMFGGNAQHNGPVTDGA
jgi:Ca-activated chloride channel family protein